MPNSLVAASSAQGTAPQTTSPGIDTTGATFLVFWIGPYSSDPSIASVSDSKSNNWHYVATYGANNANGGFWYAYDSGAGAALQVGSGHTVTVGITPAQLSAAYIFCAFSGTLTGSDPTDQHNGAGGGNVQSLATGSITPGQNNELILAAGTTYTDNSSSTNWTFDNSLATAQQVADIAAVVLGAAIGWKQQGTASAINVTVTSGAGAGHTYGWAAGILSVKAAPNTGIPNKIVLIGQAVNRANTY